jgi:hypothetical protein
VQWRGQGLKSVVIYQGAGPNCKKCDKPAESVNWGRRLDLFILLSIMGSGILL